MAVAPCPRSQAERPWSKRDWHLLLTWFVCRIPVHIEGGFLLFT